MNKMLTYSREAFEKNGIDIKEVMKLIKRHQSDFVPEIEKCFNYYEGRHAISEDPKQGSDESAKVTCNHAKDISDTASGYFMGNPIVYGKANDKIKDLTEAFDAADVDDLDQDHALTLSICGRDYEYIYAKEGQAELTGKDIDPRNCFVVYDDSIEHRKLFGVFYFYRNEKEVTGVTGESGTQEGVSTYVNIYTDTECIECKSKGETTEELRRKTHDCGFVPIIEFLNNKFGAGDFVQQISLIDAYNTLMSDRITDKEQFIDAILVLYGSILGDTEEESKAARKELKEKKVLELDAESKAEYLTRTFDEGGMEIIRTALKEDIYTLSHVPNLTDKNFAGNSSGVAMEYKLLALETLTKIKEKYYRKALRERIKIFCHFLGLKSKAVDPVDATPTFSRGLPKNLLEISQIITNLEGKVSIRTLLGLIPFVEDPDEEINATREETEEAISRQKEIFEAQNTGNTNTPPDDEDE